MAGIFNNGAVYGTMTGEEDKGSTAKVPDNDNGSTQSPDVENAFVAPLHRKLKSRHLTMIAIGGMH
jgi:amino acid permease